ncbi:hypothetical protein DBB36_15105 [Flavobacterium sp. WLB]|uniref:hypothetical protein n=1 Tax=unclassified Flavobacterium TaxID=196869 RepID=UPI0006ABC484|nr:MULTISPECIES: hypothetical protein [unclassified Flavobacterium]KOP36451.1 hypothetical protein AKO67_18675 [Flavobacterium sp. VMW]OWU90600.1 hypothetical protein APR43_11505 [Flavobacterium sp. NLM]PUU69181.1 hypothetical protein DBB36_15105 [Flavobacterium sp. WLB]
MKRLIKLSVILLIITSFGCTSDPYNCTTSPPSVTFEFVDKTSGENLFKNGTFDAKKAVTITDLNENKIIQYAYLKEDNLYRLGFNAMGWDAGTFKYAVKIEDKSIFEFHVSTEKRKSEHCSSTVITSLQIKNVEFQEDKTTGVYKILIDTQNQ